MLDYVLKGGRIVDGTGSESFTGDVGIRDGRIVEIGEVRDSAQTRIDATGLVVAPGFIDVHTHYDGQVNWDPYLTPSSWHGVTTVIAGNCGFTVAPINPESVDYVLRMMSVVEGIPYSALATIDASWESFGSWLDRLEGNLGINAGFFAGHSTLRRAVMGDGAVGEQADGSGPTQGAVASDEQIRQMKELLDKCLSDGAIGFSTSRSGHTDHHGLPVPSRAANEHELLELCSVLRGHDGTMLGFSPDQLFSSTFTDQMTELMMGMALAAGRPLIVNGPLEGKLQASTLAAERGAQIFAMFLAHPNPLRLTFDTGLVLDALPQWNKVMHLPHDEKKRALANSDTRRILREGALSAPHMNYSHYGSFVIYDVASPDLKKHVGRTVGDIADERGVDPFDAMLDLALSDDLQTGFLTPRADVRDPTYWARAAKAVQDPRTVLAGSDAGAHLDMVISYDTATYLVGPAVRDGFITLEGAIQQATDVPARVFGLKDRGRITAGYRADIVVFDEARLLPSAVKQRFDLPGGSWRLTSEAEGLEHVFVNGRHTLTGNQFTGDLPGTVLRSGRDTTSAER